MTLLKKKIFWIALIVIAALVAAGYLIYSTQIAAQAASEQTEPEMQTAVAHVGEIIIIASGTGRVAPASQISLGFEDSGTLTELNVLVGSVVKAGDVLARLQTSASQASVDSSIADAQLAVIQAQNALDDLYANADISRTTAMNNIVTYAQQVRDAQYQLENYTMPVYLQGMDTIEALDLMKQQLDTASQAFVPYRLYPSENDTRYSLLVALNEAQSRYDAAVKRLNYEYVLQVAEANLDKARQEYEKYKDGPAQDEVDLAQAELDNAQAKLELAKDTQSIISLVAPMDGTVMEIASSSSEVVGENSSFITLADLQQPVLTVYLDETDLHLVAVGYTAEITFDAYPDTTFTGHVTTINPSLVTVSNVQAIEVQVVMEVEDLSPGDTFPVGLNASVDIIAGRAENAVLVPVEALREVDPGEYAVFVIENGELVVRVVEVGLQDITYAQIISGLQSGEVVSTGIVQSQ